MIAPEIILPGFDINRLLEEDEAVKGKDVPYRFGKGFDVNYSLADGKWTKVDSGRVWLMKVTSPGAYSINFIFNELYLPDGAELYIYNADGSMVYGPVTSKQNLERRLFLTDIIKGESAILYLYMPEDKGVNTKLVISRIVHGYKDLYAGLFESTKGLGDSGDCEEDVACYPDWSNESNAVALVFLANGDSICTGSLLNNTAQDFRAYFLTAFHCIDVNLNGSISATEKSNAENWMFKFHYKKTSCDGSEIASTTTYNHDNFRAAWNTTDFALVELANSPLYNTCLSFLGWDKTGSTPTEGTGIHHPMGDVMKISFDNNQLFETTIWQNSGSNHWRVIWDIGATEPGSSGSPLFDQNKRVIGQLSGGPSECDGSDMRDWYGCLYRSWTGGGHDTTRLSSWLDPIGGYTTLNTIRYLPEITGPDLVCISNATYTLHNRPPGTTVAWTHNRRNLQYVSGQGTDNYMVKANSNDARSTGWVMATITGSCDIPVLQNSFWVGRPGTPVTTPDGDPPIEVLYGSSFMVRLFASQTPGAEPTTGEWVAMGSIVPTTPTSGRSWCYFNANSFGYGQWHVYTSNNCGISDTYIGSVIVPWWKFGMSPNPADDYVEITAEKKEYDTKGIVSDKYEVKILNNLKSVVYESAKTNQTSLRISTKHFISGTYFVYFTAGEQKEVKQLIIIH